MSDLATTIVVEEAERVLKRLDEIRLRRNLDMATVLETYPILAGELLMVIRIGVRLDVLKEEELSREVRALVFPQI